jgi:hypothetical protein
MKDSDAKDLSKNYKRRAETIETRQMEITEARFRIITIATHILEVSTCVTSIMTFEGFERGHQAFRNPSRAQPVWSIRTLPSSAMRVSENDS